MSCVIKAHLETADGSVEVRRIVITREGRENSGDGLFLEVASKVGGAFPSLASKRFSLHWKDSDDDLVVMSTDEEMLEALSHAQNSPLKVFVAVTGTLDSEPADVPEMQTDQSNEPTAEESSGTDQEAGDTCGNRRRCGNFMGRHFHPPPFFGFNDRTPFGHFGAFSRGRGHHPHFFRLGARGHPAPHHGPRGHPGYPFDHHGKRGHHFGPHGNSGHHFGPHGNSGHHFGRHGHQEHHGMHGMFGPFGGFGVFDRPSPFSCPETGSNPGHHFGPHHHGKRHHGKDGWKDSLRGAVPVAHRRWVKALIRTWRVENLKNATSTSSDSDQDFFTVDDSIVPEAYSDWLNEILPRWHQKLGQESAVGDADKQKSSDEKDKLKASVPVEFRKWTKWYLSRHFGKKDAPKFRKHGSFDKCGKKLQKHEKKEWKKACKIATLGVSIPMVHRMWAKIFIQDWRQEHKIPDPKATGSGTVSSESEDNDGEFPRGDIAVPNDYTRWMRKFLARWHYWRGEVQHVDIEMGGMAEFKDLVPKNFRKWVKCFLWRRYGNGISKEADTAAQYQKWLKAFQQKWLAEKEKESSAEEVDLTTDDEVARLTTESADSNEKNVESSLKKLRLVGDEDEAQRSVRFSPGASGTDKESSPRKFRKDIGDYEGALFHKTMNAGFRNWAKEALWQWDGRTAASQESTEGAVNMIPPHVYRWMSQMMNKVQMKKMKQELKMAKHSLKAAMKAKK